MSVKTKVQRSQERERETDRQTDRERERERLVRKQRCSYYPSQFRVRNRVVGKEVAQLLLCREVRFLCIL